MSTIKRLKEFKELKFPQCPRYLRDEDPEDHKEINIRDAKEKWKNSGTFRIRNFKKPNDSNGSGFFNANFLFFFNPVNPIINDIRMKENLKRDFKSELRTPRKRDRK